MPEIPCSLRSALLALALVVPGFRPGVAAEESPGPRYGHEMVYDEARNVTLLFGGFGPDGEPKADTWGIRRQLVAIAHDRGPVSAEVAGGCVQ